MLFPIYPGKIRLGSRFGVPALLMAAFVAVSLLFAQSPSRAADQAQSGWHISKTSGDVRYRLSDNPGTPWILAKKDAVITAQARFETGADGKVTLTRNGDRIGMSPNSRILLPGALASRKVTTIIQSVGIMLYKVKRRAGALLVSGQPGRRFEVRTPYLVTIVKGTTFAISANSRGAAVNLIEGILDVSSPSGDVVTRILGGQIASATKAARGVISVIKINGTGHKVFRSQRAIEAKAKGGKSSGGAPLQAAKVSAPTKPVRGGNSFVTTRSVSAIDNRGQATKKTVISSLAAFEVAVSNDRGKTKSAAKVTVIALATPGKPVTVKLKSGPSQLGKPAKEGSKRNNTAKGNNSPAPSVSAPSVSAPSVSTPSVSTPTVSVSTPTVSVSTPTVSVPTVSAPIVSVGLPSIIKGKVRGFAKPHGKSGR